jgi:hypothetical protein
VSTGHTIVVDHLARFGDGSVLVGGINSAHEHVWPHRRRPWDTDSTVPAGGPFGVGQVVDLGPSRQRGIAPAAEEREVDEGRVRRLGRAGDADFWSLIEMVGRDSVLEIFGDDLELHSGGSASVPEGRVRTSLGCLRCPGPAEIFRRGRQVRFGLDDLRLGSLDLSLHDLRLHDAEGEPIDALWKVLRRRVVGGEPLILSVGLSALFNGSHWLQIHNIHFRDYFDDHPVFFRFRG